MHIFKRGNAVSVSAPVEIGSGFYVFHFTVAGSVELSLFFPNAEVAVASHMKLSKLSSGTECRDRLTPVSDCIHGILSVDIKTYHDDCKIFSLTTENSVKTIFIHD